MKLSRERKVYAAVLGLAAVILGADRFILGGNTFAAGAAAAASAPSTDADPYTIAPGAPSPAGAQGPSLANRLESLLPEPPPPPYPRRPASFSWRITEPHDSLLRWSTTAKHTEPRGLFSSSATWLIPADLEALATPAANPGEKAASLSDVLAKHRISSVVTGAKPFVIIDGKPVALGATFDGVKVARIERATRTAPAAVTFARVGEQIRLELH